MATHTSENTDENPPSKKIKLTHKHNEDKSTTCAACLDNLEEQPYITPCRTCPTAYCYSCLALRITSALEDSELMPIRCCDKIIYHKIGQGIVKDTVLQQYQIKYEEKATIDPYYCPVPTCSQFIAPRLFDPNENGIIKCPMCETQSCPKCRVIATTDHTCDEADDTATQEMLENFGYKQCPKCNHAVMKMYGCVHMKCICGAHWCWECLQPIEICNANPCEGHREDSEFGDGFDDMDDDDDDDDEEDEEGEDNENEEQNEEPQQPPPPPPPPPSTNITGSPNLDHPRLDWYGERFNFGREPRKEEWDVWGCVHVIGPLKMEHIPERYMAGIDKSRDIWLECMECFGEMKVSAEEGYKKKDRGYQCLRCGVLYCRPCKKEKLKGPEEDEEIEE